MYLWLARIPCTAAVITVLSAAIAVAQLPAEPAWKPGSLKRDKDGSVGLESPPGSAPVEARGSTEPVPIVYSRCVRTRGEVTIQGVVERGGIRRPARRTVRHPDIYDILPDVSHAFSGFNAPCDLIFRDAEGSERLLFDCTSRTTGTVSCAALDAAVSFDGRTVAFAVFFGRPYQRQHTFPAQLLDRDAENRERFHVLLPNRYLKAEEARLYLADIATGRLSALPHRPGDFDAGPAWLSNGRIAFTSTRSGHYSTLVPGATGQRPASQIFTMDPDGRNVEKASHHALAGELHPLQLKDGRLALSSWQIFGLLPFRTTNGSRGGFGTIANFFHIYGQNPDGGNQFALYGQHTVSRTSPSHHAAHFIGQSANGWFLVADYYRANNLGLGTIFQFPLPHEGQEGIGPDENPGIGDIYRPRHFSTLTPWAASGDNFSGPMPPPGYRVPSYRDPIAFAGKVSHPSGLPGNQVLLTYGLGPCSTVGDDRALPKPRPPLVSGSGSLIPMNAMTHLGLDNPGCDTGIYRTTRNPSRHPSDLRAVVNRRDYHEILARPALPYEAIYGIAAPPIIPRADIGADDPALAAGTPFGLLGAASITFRETRPIGGIPFEGENQWGLQGADAVDYTDEELCGIRILAVHPNGAEEYRRLHSATGERISILGEFPVRKGRGNPDTSFLVRFPSNTPYLMQGVDCLGRTLNTDQTWQHLRPGERKVCGGCHVHGKAGLPFERSAAARPGYQPVRLGEGKVPLLRGGSGHEVRVEEHDGHGLTIEFMRDVMPIFRKRCVQCHGENQAKAGLRLDIAGVDKGSTWWRLVRDGGQAFVPPALRHPSGALRKPQLSKYVRFMNSRGSQLYWKAANRRLDGRSDAQYGPGSPRGWNDVDFGADHPTSITDDELAMLSRWIDTGSAAGPEYAIDLIPPVLNVAGLVTNDTVTVLRIGTADVSSGIDRSSLEVCIGRGGDICGERYRPAAAAAGIVSLPVWFARHDVDREVRVRVSDRAGNRTEVRRTVGWFLRQEKDRAAATMEKAALRD